MCQEDRQGSRYDATQTHTIIKCDKGVWWVVYVLLATAMKSIAQILGCIISGMFTDERERERERMSSQETQPQYLL